MRGHDEIRLRHMLEAAREAVWFACSRARADLETDRQWLLSLVKDSADRWRSRRSRFTDSTRKELGEIPWASIIAMRNRPIHAYFSIGRDIVWKTMHEDLPGLIGTEVECYQTYMDALVLGPGNIEQAHTVGEWIAVEQLERAVDVYSRLIGELCG